jgi:zinc protease
MKNQLRYQEVMNTTTVASKAERLGTCAVLYGNTDRVNQRLRDIDAVTIQDVQRVAKKYLVPNNRRDIRIEPSSGGVLKSLFGGGKKADEEEGPAPKEPTENVVVDRKGPKADAMRPLDFPEKPPVAGPIDSIIEPTVAKKTLPNGLQIAVISNREVPLLSLVLGIRNGAVTERKPGVANMAMSMLAQGTNNRTAKQMAETLESNAITMTGSATMDSATIQGSSLADKAELAMELLADMSRNPIFPKDEFKVLLSQQLVGLTVSTKTPEYLADREFRRRIYGEHPYARTVTGEVADVRGIKIDDLKEWVASNVRPENCTLYLAGDISSDTGFAVAEKYFGDWKVEGTPTPPALPPFAQVESTQIILYDRPGSEQSQIRVGHRSIGRSDPDYSKGVVMSNILGGSFNSRLNKAIRVEKGLTYGARGSLSTRRHAGEFQISTFSKTVSTAETLQVILDVIQVMQSTVPTTVELGDTQTYITGSFAGDRETPQSTIMDLWLAEIQNLPADYQKQFLSEVTQMTSSDIQRTAESLIHNKALVIVVVGEAAKIKEDLERIAPVTVIDEESP